MVLDIICLYLNFYVVSYLKIPFFYLNLQNVFLPFCHLPVNLLFFMPYRRLPNTDKSRVNALKNAVECFERQEFGQQVISFKTQHEAKTFLTIFEQQSFTYQQTLDNQVSANKRYQQIVHMTRLYVSHFIQVFNMAVTRGEIKKEHKLLYQLEPEVNALPDLSTDKMLLHWGKCIIDGENERLRNGGTPIYNPQIAKVKVHYEIFKEYRQTQKFHQNTTNRNWEELVKLREKADKILLDIWNQVEEYYKNEKPYSRLIKCQEFGLVYYYRKGEKELTPRSDKEM